MIETSLNAINYLENTALYLKPDIAIITGIGEAHFSTFKSVKDIAKIKTRILRDLQIMEWQLLITIHYMQIT